MDAGERAHGGGVAEHDDNEERNGSVIGESGH
jgi:hypothetical protein